MPAVPDASPLIVLGKVEAVDLLPRLYGKVLLTPWVWEETVTKGKAMGAPDAARLQRLAREAGWARVRLTKAEGILAHRLVREAGIGSGEAEVLAVARNRKALAILDDKDARILAIGMGISQVGSIGVLYEAFIGKLIDYEELLELAERLGKVAWVSPDLVAGLVRRARDVRSRNER